MTACIAGKRFAKDRSVDAGQKRLSNGDDSGGAAGQQNGSATTHGGACSPETPRRARAGTPDGRNSGGSTPGDPPGVISQASAAIKAAVNSANGPIATVNADVAQAYEIGNGLATGQCSGSPPSPIYAASPLTRCPAWRPPPRSPASPRGNPAAPRRPSGSPAHAAPGGSCSIDVSRLHLLLTNWRYIRASGHAGSIH